MKIAFKINGHFNDNLNCNNTVLDDSIFNLKSANDEILSIELDHSGNIETIDTYVFSLTVSNQEYWQLNTDKNNCVNDVPFSNEKA